MRQSTTCRWNYPCMACELDRGKIGFLGLSGDYISEELYVDQFSIRRINLLSYS